MPLMTKPSISPPLNPSAFAKSVAHPMSTPERNQEDPRAKTIADTMMYKLWRAHRGNPIPHIDDERGIPDEYDEDESDAVSEFDERNIELESWLAE